MHLPSKKELAFPLKTCLFPNHQITCECFWYNRWDQTSERIFPPITQDTSFPSDVSVYPELVLIDWIICHQPLSFPIRETSKQKRTEYFTNVYVQYFFSIFQCFSVFYNVFRSFSVLLLDLIDLIICHHPLSFPIWETPKQKRKEYFTKVYVHYLFQYFLMFFLMFFSILY